MASNTSQYSFLKLHPTHSLNTLTGTKNDNYFINKNSSLNGIQESLADESWMHDAQFCFINAQRMDDKGKKTLILEINGILIYCDFNKLEGNKEPDLKYKLYTDNGQYRTLYVYFRPYMQEYLSRLS